MKIILTGFMYSGKSSVARQLSQKMDLKLIDMDQLVIKNSARKSITEIFEKDGEPKFRELEKNTTQKIKDQTNSIISTGGGVGVNKTLINELGIEGTIIFLHATFETIVKRMGKNTSRPLMKNKEKVEQLYKTRLPLYREHADIIVRTDNYTIAEVSDKIMKALKDEL